MPDAIKLQQRIKAQLELASLPGLSNEEQEALLHIIIVGGGPTGVEIAAEMSDLFHNDLAKIYPHLADKFHISIHDAANTILGPFEESLRQHSLRSFSKRGVSVHTGSMIKSVDKDGLTTESDGKIPCGTVIWTAGNKQSSLVDKLTLAKTDKMPRLLTDEYLHALDANEQPIDSVYALGDAADIRDYYLPSTAEVAAQEATYLVEALNKRDDTWAKDPATGKSLPFEYKQKPTVAYLGGHDGVIMGNPNWTGDRAWAAWRSKNLSWVRNWRRRILILVTWGLDRVYGREGVVSRFMGEKIWEGRRE